MIDIEVVAFAAVGLVLGSLAWTVAVLQVGLTAAAPTPASPPGSPSTASGPGGGPVPSSTLGWLPLWGFGADRSGADAGRGGSRPLVRAAVEVAVAVYLGVLAGRADSTADLAPVALFAFPLLVIALVDWWTRVIYTNWIAVGTVLALGVAAVHGLHSFLEALGGLATGAAVFGAFYVVALLLYRDVRVVSLGAGDVFLAGMIGAMTGDVLAAVGTLFYGILLAAVGAGVLLIARRGTQRKALPSGAYLCAGAFIGLALQVW